MRGGGHQRGLRGASSRGNPAVFVKPSLIGPAVSGCVVEVINVDCEELLAEIIQLFLLNLLLLVHHMRGGGHQCGLRGASGRGKTAVFVKPALIGPAHACMRGLRLASG
jgi:hypothetical protein